MKFGVRTILSRKVPTLLALPILVLGLVGGVMVVSKKSNFGIKAGPTSVPKNVRVTNLSHDKMTISWVTDTPVVGFVKYSENPSNINTPAGDGRDQRSGSNGLYTTHSVDLNSLSPTKTYYFEVGSGSVMYDDSGRPYQATTFAAMAVPSEDVANGKVLATNGQAAGGVLVYAELEAGQGLSTISRDDGTWRINLSEARGQQGQPLGYNTQTTRINLFFQGGLLGSSGVTTTTGQDSPVPDTVLGRTYNYIDPPTPTATMAPTSPTPSVGASNPFGGMVQNQPTPSVVANSGIQLENPAFEGEAISTGVPELRGTAPAGVVLSITVHSETVITGQVVVGNDGQWSFTPPSGLEPGEHTVTVEYTDLQGVVQRLTRSFVVLADDGTNFPAFTSTPSATPTLTITPTPTPTYYYLSPTATPSTVASMPSTNSSLPTVGSLTPTVALFILGVGLFVLGVFWRNKLAKYTRI